MPFLQEASWFLTFLAAITQIHLILESLPIHPRGVWSQYSNFPWLVNALADSAALAYSLRMISSLGIESDGQPTVASWVNGLISQS